MKKLSLFLLVFTAVSAGCAKEAASRKANSNVSSTSPTAGSRATAPPAQFKAAHWRATMGFEANRGQADASVKFIARGDGYSLSLAATEAAFRFQSEERIEGRGSSRQVRSSPSGPRASSLEPRPSVLRMKFLGAHPQPLVFGRDEQPGRSHYLMGNDRRRHLAGVPRYASVEYREVYPGVNLVFHERRRQLEYDFVVAPGADPRAIRLGFAGAKGMEINARGDLVLRVAGGEIVQRAPVVFQETERGQRTVEGRYIRAGRDEIAFEIGDYDRGRALVIDPALSFATYLGGGADSGNAIAVDAAGSVYVAGTTSSPGFPARNGAGAFLNGGADVFVAKLNAAGALVYATYIGGSGNDFGFGVAVDANGAAYVTGSTASNDYPTTNAFQNTLRGNPNAFLTKLNAAGDALVYSTYLGGGGFDEGLAVAVDAAGNAYVAGDADSANFPVTQGALKTRLSEFATNAFVTKFNAAGAPLVYSTFLGGSDLDLGFGIAVDGQGNAHVTGLALSEDFPTTPGAIQARGGEDDGFVAKLNATGSALVYSTYLGGGGSDFANGVALDAAGAAYVVGATGSTNLPTTPDAFQRNYGGGASDGFGVKLGPDGSLLFATYFGGGGNDEGLAVSVDGAGNICATGVTDSTNLMTVNPLQGAISGGGVFKSVDGASNWNASSAGLLSATISLIAIDPATPTTLYASTSGGIFKSTDGAANWSASNSGLPAFPVLSLAIDPMTPATLYAGVSARGVFKSANGGGSWSASNTGILEALSVNALAVNPTTPATLYAGAGFLVFRSTNGGVNWTQTINLSSTIRALAIDPATPATLYAGTSGRGVFKSANAASNWSAINTRLANLNVRALAIDPSAPTTIYAGTLGGGVFKSVNGGNNWSAANTGLANLNIRALAIAPTNPPTIYAGTNSGVFKSADGGGSWRAANAGLASPQTLSLAVDPRAPAMIYIGTNGNDAFIAKIGASGSLLFSTYFGGGGSDSGFGVAADGAGNIHVTGSSSSVNFPVTPGAIQSAASGSVAFIAKISDAFTCSLACAATGPGSGTAGLPAAFTASATPSGCAGATGYVWDFGDGSARVFQQNPSHVYLSVGTHTWAFAATNAGAPACSRTGTITITGRGVANVSAASFTGDEIAPDSIVSAFGSNLATATQAATTTPLPTSLAGTTVRVRDSAGVERLAPLFFVSPGQINYHFPPGTATGPSTVTVTSGDGTVSLGTVQAAALAPGLFAANASGQGVAAGVVVRVRAGAQSAEPIARFDSAQNRFVSVPIDLGPSTDQVFLVLFGTGIRNRGVSSMVSARIGGAEAQVSFAGAQGGLVGLDQINALIPRSLIGKGEVNVALTVGGRAVNLVRVNIR